MKFVMGIVGLIFLFAVVTLVFGIHALLDFSGEDDFEDEWPE